MKKLFLLLLGLCLMGCLMACAAVPGAQRGDGFADKPQGTDTVQEAGANDVSQQPQRQWSLLMEEVNADVSAEDGRLLVQARYALPRMNSDGEGEALTTNSTAAEYINRYFAQWMEQQRQFLEDIADMAREHYQLNDLDDRWSAMEYSYTDTVTAEHWTNGRLLCVSMHYTTYSGGAHPNAWREAVSFDLEKARTVTMPDLTDRLEELREMVTKNLLHQIKKSDVWEEVGFFPDYENTVAEWMDKTLIFGDSGLTVVFATYDIASYAAGEQAFLVSYSALRPYLNDYALSLLGL